ncbi:MAG: SDR family oxidoreductase, partial [Opitutaceae bacterium]|nr:SDR family oxidoreductase [Opitutaceae bacterium]
MTAPEIFSLKGHTALVTGGGSGIGLATAHALAACGAKVILGGRREKELNEAATAIGPLASAQVMDVTDTAAMPALAAALREQHGPVSLLINNAGINLKRPFVDTTESELLGILQTNVIGAMALTRALHPQLQDSGRGSVVFISSMAALFGIPWV